MFQVYMHFEIEKISLISADGPASYWHADGPDGSIIEDYKLVDVKAAIRRYWER